MEALDYVKASTVYIGALSPFIITFASVAYGEELLSFLKKAIFLFRDGRGD